MYAALNCQPSYSGVTRLIDLLDGRLVRSSTRESSTGTSRGSSSSGCTCSSVSLGHLRGGGTSVRGRGDGEEGERTMGLATASSSFCFSEYSSVEASALASSHEMVSVMALSSASLSAASSLSLRSPSTEFRRLYAYVSSPFLAVMRAVAASSSDLYCSAVGGAGSQSRVPEQQKQTQISPSLTMRSISSLLKRPFSFVIVIYTGESVGSRGN
jgi:hypothetical protein